MDPLAHLAERLAAAGCSHAVGLMTSRNLDNVHTATHTAGDVRADAVATVGLSNALRIGDPPGFAPPAGTINILVRTSVGLTVSALVEAIAMVAEARTAAVREAGWPSSRSGAPSTGTGTDCIVVAAPLQVPEALWCGKHTDAGSAIGAAALAAVADGVSRWLAQHR